MSIIRQELSDHISSQLLLNQENYHPTHPLVYIHGPSATGKTFALKKLMDGMDSTRVAWINIIQRYTDQLLFESILNQLSGMHPTAQNEYSVYARAENTSEFLYKLIELLDNQDQLEGNILRYLVLDRVDALESSTPTLFGFLCKLYELTGGRLVVIMVSQLAWQDMYKKNNILAMAPFVVYFPPLSKHEILEIIKFNVPKEEEDVDFYISFASIVYDTYQRRCRDLNEISYLVSVLYPKYLEPVLMGKATKQQTSKLMGHVSKYLQSASNDLHLRQTSISENSQKAYFELSYYSKFLLIASFLASFNPARFDMRFFSRSKEDRVVKRQVSKKREKVRQQLLGPKAFHLERMLGIFYNIIQDPIQDSISIMQQISTLVSLKLIARMSSGEKLDHIKLKCCASFTLVKEIGNSIQFDVSKYLYDWIDVE